MSTAMTIEQMTTEFLKLKQENEKLKANVGVSHGIKVSTKGAVSVYGLGRFPVTLYSSQWQTLFAKQADVLAFIETNKATLSAKPAAPAKAV
jgi:hypothetical protein